MDQPLDMITTGRPADFTKCLDYLEREAEEAGYEELALLIGVAALAARNLDKST